MYRSPDLTDEPARLAALQRLAVMDTAPEEPFENVVALVRTVLSVPIAAVSLLDADRQWFKARSGIDASQTPRDLSFCTHAIAQRDPLVVPDATKDLRFADNPFVIGDPSIRSYAGVPLRTPDGYNIGSLCAIDTQARDFSPAEIAILDKFARIVVDELELRRIAGRDQLTGVLTRRGFIQSAEHEIERFRRYDRPASLAMLDIDRFKSINDTYGHPSGDVVLRQVAMVLDTVKRPNDVLGRLGGEEFAMLMPETDQDAALAASDRFREAIASARIESLCGAQLDVTASFGVASLGPATVDAEAWLASADAPLYAAKRGGRNRCMAAGFNATA
ncbi:GGDEF domain-containing protein [Novosphingobium fluoreni]|uniref:GGDEF domain-containing protein n=1 Tax=Novosphingobium fluoreni TaxID=1391222 RepID=UPI003DA08332